MRATIKKYWGDRPFFTNALLYKMIVGGSFALILINIFLLKAGEPDPSWGWSDLWMIRPLLIVPLAGAMGGAFFHIMEPIRRRGGKMRWLALAISLAVYIIGFFMGFVLGLDGTYWD
jgi:hypothetical protein